MSVYVEMEAAQFENVNAVRKYPFADNASLVDSEGKELPYESIVDVHLVVPGNYGTINTPGQGEAPAPEVRMSSFHISKAMVSACFTSELNGTRSAMSVTVSASGFKPYFPYRLEKLYGSEDIGGIVTFGDVFSRFSFDDGIFVPETYFLDAAYIHPCLVSAIHPAGLRRFIDGRTGESVSGDVEIEFPRYVKASREGGFVTLSLEDGAYEELASECANVSGAEACGTTPIASINGVYPDDNGEIVLWFH